MTDVTQILSRIEQCDPSAAEQLLPLVYDELRKLAAAKLAREKPGQTIQPTVLVHEAWLRLVGSDVEIHWKGRGHFFGAAAKAMQRILVENARRKKSLKAGGDYQRVELSEQRTASACVQNWLASVPEPVAGEPVSPILQHAGEVTRVSFSSDGQYLVTACADRLVRIWDWRTGRMVGRQLEHGDPVSDAWMTADGAYVISGTGKGLHVWDRVAGMPVCPPLHTGAATLRIAMTPDGRRVVSGGFHDRLPLYDVESLTRAELSISDPDKLVRRAELASGNRVLESGSAELLSGSDWLKRWRDRRSVHASANP